MVCCTVSIQKVAYIWTASAFGPVPVTAVARPGTSPPVIPPKRPPLRPPVNIDVNLAAVPFKKAMFVVPPPWSEEVGDEVETVKEIVLVIVFPWLASRSTVLGSVSMA